ncbi:hypothetical protein [Stakelama pacifica]|nr:hypothetical protein [Stakelama pacifica]
MTSETDSVKVIQADRDRAAEWTRARCRTLGLSEQSIAAINENLSAGAADDDELVQAFALHRIAHSTDSAGLVEAAAKIAEKHKRYEASDFPVCQSIADDIRALAQSNAVPSDMGKHIQDFRWRARTCRTNPDAYCEKSAAVWDMAADALEAGNETA